MKMLSYLIRTDPMEAYIYGTSGRVDITPFSSGFTKTALDTPLPHVERLILKLVNGQIAEIIEYVAMYPEILELDNQPLVTSTGYALYGTALSYLGRLTEAMEALRCAYRILYQSNLLNKASLVYSLTAIVCMENMQYSPAIRYVLRAYHLAKKSESQAQISHAYLCWIGSLFIFEKFGRLTQEIASNPELTSKNSGDVEQGYFLSFKSLSRLMLGDARQAMFFSFASQEIMSPMKSRSELPLQIRARILTSTGSYHQAINNLNISMEMCVEQGHYQGIATSASLLAKTYLAAGKNRHVRHLENTLLKEYPLQAMMPKGAFYLDDISLHDLASH